MGVRRPSGDEGGAGEQHPVRLRHALVREHASSLRQIQQGHRLRRRFGKSICMYLLSFLDTWAPVILRQ